MVSAAAGQTHLSPKPPPGCRVWASRSSRGQPVATLFISPTQQKHGKTTDGTIARRPEKTRYWRTAASAVLPAPPPRTTSACAPSSLLYSNFDRVLPPSSRLQVSRGRRLSSGGLRCGTATRWGWSTATSWCSRPWSAW